MSVYIGDKKVAGAVDNGLLLSTYPKGSVYVTYEYKNPSTFIGGEWELIGGEDASLNYYPAFAIETDAPGTTIAEELPNIVGTFYSNRFGEAGTVSSQGALYRAGSSAQRAGTDGGGSTINLGFDASRTTGTGNGIYKDNAHVNVNSIKLFYWRRTDDGKLYANDKLNIATDDELKTVSRIDFVGDEDKKFEVMTENAIAKILRKSMGMTYAETDNSLAQTMYDIANPVGRTILQPEMPVVPEGVTATWEQVEGKYLCFGDSTHADGSTLNSPQLPNITGTSGFLAHNGGGSGAFRSTSNGGANVDGSNKNWGSFTFDASLSDSTYKNNLTGADKVRPVTKYLNGWKRIA